MSSGGTLAGNAGSVATRAVVFDLYGTLLEIRAPRLGRALPAVEGISRREWVSFQREELLRRPLPSREAFLTAILDRFGGTGTPAADALRARLDEELASIQPIRGALSVVPFLKRRGLRVGVLSNAASVYREPLTRWNLETWFDCVLLSADLGTVKPEPAVYRAILERLFPDGSAQPEEVLFVGDSWNNDVLGPRAEGMRALYLRQGGGSEWGTLQQLALLGWTDLDTGKPFLAPGTEVKLGGVALTLGPIEPLEDEEQGRYNLVGRAEAYGVDGESSRVYLKRFLLPEACEVECVVARCIEILGLQVCDRSQIAIGSERFLITSEAPGEKLQSPLPEPGYARAVGRQAAAAYLLANADLRPRNAFFSVQGEEVLLTLVDYEHCLLNLALDLDGIADPLNRASLEALGREALRSRIRRRVLADAHMRRAYRAFLGSFSSDAVRRREFTEGWIEIHEIARGRRADLLALIEGQLQRETSLVVGTQAYRRALIGLDLEDLAERIDEPPEQAVRRCF